VVITNLSCCGGNQSSQCMNKLSGLIQICWLVFSQPALNGCRTHQVDGGGIDDFNGWNFGYVSGCAIQTGSSSLGLSLLE
jgi:hypothetical protein